MIVKSIPAGWEILYQRAHGLLAAELAHHWKITDRPPYFVQTLLAIAEHDDGMPEAQVAENLTEAGAPKHFRLLKKSAQQYRNVMEISTAKSQWNGLMTSMHMTFLYADADFKDKDLENFVHEQEEFQKRVIKELKITRKAAEKAYRYVEWCDALSLLLCMDQVQPEQRKMDISTGPDGTMYQLWKDPKDAMRVEPWPFEEEEFKVGVEYRELTQLKFDSVEEFTKCLNEAKVNVRTWTFTR